MTFAASSRVKVSSQNSEHRNLSGTVEVAAADSPDGFNKVRLDGSQVGNTVNLTDKELVTTNFTSPVDYGS